MCKRIYLIICALIFVSGISAQEISREQKIEELRIVAPQIEQTQAKLNELESRQEKIIEDILAVSSQDVAEAEQIGAKAARIFPAGMLKTLIPSEDDTDFSAYFFDQISDYYYAPILRYENNALVFEKIGNKFGLIGNIGGTLLETINEQNKEFIALAKYEIPKDFKNVENEFSFNSVNFRNKIQIVVGNTYLVRAFNNSGSDGIFALKIHRKDSDGSIVLFVKLIKDFSRIFNNADDLFDTADKIKRAADETSKALNQANSEIPPPPPVADYETQQAVTNALYQKGFYNVTVEATTTEVTIRGTIPKGKMAEVMRTVTEIAKRRVNNQVMEER